MKVLFRVSVVMMTLMFGSYVYAGCGSALNNNTDAQLKKFIDDYNPFWGTWRGTYNGESVVGEFYLDSNKRFNVRGSYKTTNVKDVKITLCYTNGKFQARAYGFTANIDVLSSRRLRVNHRMLSAPITLQR